ncbi:hypothetical protein [Lysobacter enzymogenes]|uniref:hypothetical protein n=1 Tax=Lysobacter enzymogenes TaxID=69 RepID=UPI001AF14523|nr:hypothetical protein [Lysobacter enzymogenes]QQQ00812.1 hypothetical protein JHW41_22550 [Lysobacter enzymogenes]
MTYYASYGFSSYDVAGAVAEAVLHDIRVNCLGIQGFPQIQISRSDGFKFDVALGWHDSAKSSVRFSLTLSEAQSAVKKFRAKAGYDPAIFDRVQEALAKLEGAVSEEFRARITSASDGPRLA